MNPKNKLLAAMARRIYAQCGDAVYDNFAVCRLLFGSEEQFKALLCREDSETGE
jgi:hypothetical protein